MLWAQISKGIFAIVQQDLCSSVTRNSSTESIDQRGGLNIESSDSFDQIDSLALNPTGPGVIQYAKPLTTVRPNKTDSSDPNRPDLSFISLLPFIDQNDTTGDDGSQEGAEK